MREKIIVDKLSPQHELKCRCEGDVIERGAGRIMEVV